MPSHLSSFPRKRPLPAASDLPAIRTRPAATAPNRRTWARSAVEDLLSHRFTDVLDHGDRGAESPADRRLAYPYFGYYPASPGSITPCTRSSNRRQ
jgi:hypothetical protein